MKIADLVTYLDSVDDAADWLRSCGVEDIENAHRNLVSMASCGLTLDLLKIICLQLAGHLPRVGNPDRTLNNLKRFVSASRNPLSLVTLFERDSAALPILLHIMDCSQHLSDLLNLDPESFDLIRLTEGQPVDRQKLVEELTTEVSGLSDEHAVMVALRRFKRREILRIAYGDLICGQAIQTVTHQLSILADAICEAAVLAACGQLEKKRGIPRGLTGERARYVVIGLGKLGGSELNYSSDIDLMALYDVEGHTDGKLKTSNQEFFELLTHKLIHLLADHTELGSAYRVDLRLRPNGSQGPVVLSVDSAQRHYDVAGRTWERQAFVKARVVAGDRPLGESFLERLESWVYRSYLNRADITGIKALKRRIQRRSLNEGSNSSNVNTGFGGIREIEFVIQFLQLLNGGDLPQVRTGSTLKAIVELEQVGCLTMQERTLLEENYGFLRKLEHQLQIMFDLQTHALPEDDIGLRRVALRAGYVDTGEVSALKTFRNDYAEKTGQNRCILDHLLRDAFSDELETAPEVDLVLDPEPSSEVLHKVLGKYGFRDIDEAYRNVIALSRERIPFLSTRRCRHFLAAISPDLLSAIAATPDPDSTLTNLTQVSDSLGGKGVLWELFSFNPPSLHLCVRLCGTTPYLSAILTSNPGMIDELMDSLVLDRLPTFMSLEQTLSDLCRGAEDIEPILHSFKSSQHLRVGVRDILGKEDIEATTGALSHIAEVCIRRIAMTEYDRLVVQLGEPRINEDWNERTCEFTMLAMGKLGGQEPNYHSDLDIVFLYEANGNTTRPARAGSNSSTSNQHFFSELAQNIIKVANRLSPYGRLYEVNVRLRPTGEQGLLAVSLEEFCKYFDQRKGQTWERRALCRARPIYGSAEFRAQTQRVVHEVICDATRNATLVKEIREMRANLEETASRHNLKRGPGGVIDIECLVQMLQLQNAANSSELLVPGILPALRQLYAAGYISQSDFESLSSNYRFLRGVEARIRLMNTTARHDLPQDELEMAKLACLLNYPDAKKLVDSCERSTQQNREYFDRYLKEC